MGRSKSRRYQEGGRSDPPAEEAPLDIEQPDPYAPPPPPTRKQKLLLTGMIALMAAWLAFLGMLVGK
jgi:hypothetical protein